MTLEQIARDIFCGRKFTEISDIDQRECCQIQRLINAAVAKERERCAKICKEISEYSSGHEANEIHRRITKPDSKPEEDF